MQITLSEITPILLNNEINSIKGIGGTVYNKCIILGNKGKFDLTQHKISQEEREKE